MQKNEEKRVEEGKKNSWDKAEQFLASEIISSRERMVNSLMKTIGIITLLSIFAIAGLLFVNYHQSKTIEKNNQGWIDYLSEYDFVSQDGEGFNYFNSEVGGDVNNGTKSEETEE